MQAVWALGNIAGDSPECRDLVLSEGALQPLLKLLEPSAKQSMLRNATWTLSNLCRGKPQPAWHVVSPALPVVAKLLSSSTDDEVLADGCWVLSYLTDGPNEKIQALLDTGERPLSLFTQKHQAVSSLLEAAEGFAPLLSTAEVKDASALLPKLLANGVASVAALAALSTEDLPSQCGLVVPQAEALAAAATRAEAETKAAAEEAAAEKAAESLYHLWW